MLRSYLRLVLVCAALQAVCPPCAADSARSFEFYVTADYSGRTAGLASSTVWSFLGPLDQPGIRLKVDGFTGTYGYTNANVLSSGFMAGDVNAFGDVMAGYQCNWRDVWIKLYAGAAYETQTRIFWDAGRAIPQQGYGAAAAIESYWHSAGGFWTSANLSWQQVDNAGSLYGRAAYDTFHDNEFMISIGAETAATIKNADLYRQGRRLDIYNEYVREGALVNLRYWSHDLTLSGGLSRASDEGVWHPYVAVSYGKKF